MKKMKKLAVILCVLWAFALPVSAENTAEDYLKDFSELLPDGSALSGSGEDIISGVGFDALLSELLLALRGESGEALSFFLLLVGVSLAFSLSELSFASWEQGLSAAVKGGVSAVASLLVFSRLHALVLSVKVSLSELSGFFSALVPIITGISAAGGAVSSAGVQAVNMNITLFLIEKISSDFLLPLVFCMFAFALVGSLGDGMSASLAKGVRSVFMWGFGIVSATLAAAVSLQSFLAASIDSAALRAAKYAVSGSIPIVGSTVSGVLSTLSGAVAQAGASVGVGAVAMLLISSAAPVILMLLYRLALSLCLSFLDFVGAAAGARALGAFRAALDALISVYTVALLIYILEIIIFIKGGASLG